VRWPAPTGPGAAARRRANRPSSPSASIGWSAGTRSSTGAWRSDDGIGRLRHHDLPDPRLVPRERGPPPGPAGHPGAGADAPAGRARVPARARPPGAAYSPDRRSGVLARLGGAPPLAGPPPAGARARGGPHAVGLAPESLRAGGAP